MRYYNLINNYFLQAEKKNQSFVVNNELRIADIINTIVK